jgi:hypothetical protein
MNEGFAASYRYIIGVAPMLKKEYFFLNLFESFMFGDSLAVTSFAGKIADIGDFQLGNGIVIH